MPNIAYPPRRPLAVGEVLDLTFQVYRATLVRCLLPAALAVIAGQLTNIYALVKGRSLGGSGGLMGFAQALQGLDRDPLYWGVNLLGTLLTLIFYAVIILRQYAVVMGRPPAGEFAQAARRSPALVGLMILVGVSIGACLLPALLLSPPGRYALLFLLLIPASYVAVLLSCAFTVLLLTGSGPVASYLRSWRLASGSFWRLSVVYTVGVIVLLVFSGLIGGLAAFLAGILGRGDLALIAATAGVIVVGLSAVTTPLYTAMALAVFGDLTARKEGVDLEQRISAPA
jgi:hypothetical protein